MQAHPQRFSSVWVVQALDDIEVVLVNQFVLLVLALVVLTPTALVHAAVLAAKVWVRVVGDFDRDFFFQYGVAHDNDVVLGLGLCDTCANLNR